MSTPATGRATISSLKLPPAALPGLIGRRRELDALRGTLDDVRAGRGEFVLVVGAAGIGKTRFAQHIAADASRAGFRVAWGGCHERDGLPPYWPWTRALRDLPRRVAAQRGGHAVADTSLADLLLPGVERDGSGSDPGATAPPDDGSARLRVFDAIATALRRLSGRGGVLVVLDDLHWADDASLRLLEFLVRELTRSPVLFLGTSREAEPTGRHTIAGILRSIPARTLPLGGLDRPSIQQLMAAAMGRDATPDLVDRVQSLTEGNPFFVLELTSWLGRRPARGWRAMGASGIPDSITALVGRRLDLLSPPAREVVRVAAAVGRDFDAPLVVEACRDLDPAAVARRLEQAEHAGVILSGETTHRFRHAIIRQALYEEVPPARRVELHARIASALEARGVATAAGGAAELAHHFARAEPLLGPAKVIEHSTTAARHALASHAYDEADRHFQRALERLERSPDPPGAADLLFGRGQAKAAISPRWNRQAAWDHLRRAAELRLTAGDAAGATAAVTYPGITPEGARDVAAVVLRVLQRVDPASPEAGWLWARYGAAVYFETGDYDRSREAIERALAIARREADPALELRALAYAAAVDHFDGRWREVLAEGRLVVELAGGIEDAHAETYARYRISFALAFTGRADVAEAEARLNLTRAESLHDRGLLEDALYVNAVLAQLQGRWPRARDFIRRGLAIAPHHLPLLHLGVLLEHEVGELDEGSRYLERLRQAAAHAGPYPLRGAFAALAIPQAMELRDDGEVRPSDDRPTGHAVPAARFLVTAGRALEAVRSGDAPAAEDALSRLQHARGTIVAPLMVTDRLLGRLARAVGRADRADRHFRDSIGFCAKAGYAPELAWSCHDAAQLLLSRDRDEPGGEAARILDRGLEIATRLGMRPLMRRLEALRPGRRGPASDALTRRELDVLRLLATGRTNREIGEALFISPNTVAVHVAHILEKTGTRNRTEAASYATRESLVTPVE
ncbi:MAG: AAA family ATPase [Gemmatimonadetes bacterium]|nr:AAA family ATPase [Gemmatimonadota bacterium]NIQ57115.1 AAA family ATPase [Gemmatimonadota bacterium]NIU77282.1 AAA family ATPase [Gammaproteobacteria bacterium]NIX46556.1 AAA family ATPase [Gemmatimonadota bacterium]NIY10874.1 AAA family ATPase [Gemmatimonadota bacterium]